MGRPAAVSPVGPVRAHTTLATCPALHVKMIHRLIAVWGVPLREGWAAAVSQGPSALRQASIQLERDLSLVGVARQFVDQTVTDWGLDAIRYEARLITSELSANAVLHARTGFQVSLQSDGLGYLRIAVRDGNAGMPPRAAPQRDATSGRGLAVVGALATSWGTQFYSDGKAVWAKIGSKALSGDAVA